jgi:hypothetical protein
MRMRTALGLSKVLHHAVKIMEIVTMTCVVSHVPTSFQHVLCNLFLFSMSPPPMT